MMPFAEFSKENEYVHAYIVHSDDGMDEISPLKTNVVELKDGKNKQFIINPKDLGFGSGDKNLKGKMQVNTMLKKFLDIYKRNL